MFRATARSSSLSKIKTWSNEFIISRIETSKDRCGYKSVTNSCQVAIAKQLNLTTTYLINSKWQSREWRCKLTASTELWMTRRPCDIMEWTRGWFPWTNDSTGGPQLLGEARIQLTVNGRKGLLLESRDLELAPMADDSKRTTSTPGQTWRCGPHCLWLRQMQYCTTLT